MKTQNHTKSLVFSYKGNNITFLNGSTDIMINATEMAKPFGKKPVHWLQTIYAERFIQTYSVVKNRTTVDLLVVRQGKSQNFQQGTWMHKDIAIEFARWLHPEFAIWCNDRIMELVSHGFTATPKTLEEMINNPELIKGMAEKLIEEREARKLAIKERNGAIEERNNIVIKAKAFYKKAKPKIEFAEAVMPSDDLIDMSQVVRVLDLPYGRTTLFRKLRTIGILYLHRNIPKQHYMNAGYFKLKEIIINPNGYEPFVTTKIFITQKGVDFLRKILKGKEIPKRLIKVILEINRVQQARDWLVGNIKGVTHRNVRNRNQVFEVAEKYGIEFPNLK